MDVQRADYEAARDQAMALLQAAHLTGGELRALMEASATRLPEGRLSTALGHLGSVQAVDWQRMCDLLALRQRQREG